MDLRCQICSEPFEAYHIQHDVSEEEREFFYNGLGCASCNGVIPEGGRPEMAIMSGMAHDMLGDDIDGIASMLEDYESMQPIDKYDGGQW